MEAKTVLLIAIPVLLVLARLLAIATTVSRQASFISVSIAAMAPSSAPKSIASRPFTT